MNELIIAPGSQQQLKEVTKQPGHALLVVAPDGAGKRAIVKQLASQLLATTPQKLTNSGRMLVIDPHDEPTISIEQVRQARHFVTRKAHHAEGNVQRIILIVDAQRLTGEAQNALLKLLEEPPAGSLLLLTANSPEVLLPTIISRCQTLQLGKPSKNQLVEYFTAQGHQAESVQLALRISDGWPGTMQALLQHDAGHPLSTAAAQARSLLKSTAFERLALVESLAKQREACLNLCYVLQQMAHVALPTAAVATADRWQQVLTAAYDCQIALETRVNTKLAMTKLMVSL